MFHTNEGHAGFLGVERIRELAAEEGLDFDTALEVARGGTVFTTHTPVPAGIDRFPVELIQQHFGGDGAWPGVPVDRILELGAEDFDGGDPGVFNMAVMGLRLAQRANGVSKLHGDGQPRHVLRAVAGLRHDEVPITSITNGVHAPTWVAREILELAARGRRRRRRRGRARSGRPSTRSPTARSGRPRCCASGWSTRPGAGSGSPGINRGAAQAELGWVDAVLDPDVLTIGFARRVPSYKRLTLMLRDPERLKRAAADPSGRCRSSSRARRTRTTRAARS